MTSPYQDILKDSSESFEDGNYFLVTVLNLDVNSSYPLEFRWKYKDGTFGKDWSAVKYILTPMESAPNTPNFSSSNVDTTQPEKIIITWDGNSDDNTPLTGIDRVDIYIDGAPFDGSKPTDSFVTAGTKIIPAPAGTYIISLYAVSKLGTISPISTSVTKTVLAATPPVDPPTLPNGLSVATAPFAVSVNWNGSYSGGGFDGFKSVDIHVRGSDVGSSATSGFSATTQVATLTVNSTTNRQNVGLDNLRQALSLANNTAAYTAPMFFYYIARNQNDQLYSVGGVPTYTRINSSSVNPTQANFVDLANGVISIENLVAGNGQFSSWLRTGSAGGARIELSAVNDFTNGGNTVQKGLVAYSSGGTEIFNLDIDAGSLTINGSGTFTGDLTAGSGSSIFKSDSNGIYLGNAVYASAPFSVSRNGVIKANSGTVGGWTLLQNALVNTSSPVSFRIQSVTDTGDPKNKQGIIVGRTDQEYLEITSDGIVHRLANGNASGKFTLTTGSSGSLTLSGSLTVTGGNAATTTALAAVETTANNASTAASNATTTANNASTAATNAANAAATAQTTANGRLKASTNVIANSSQEITTINAGGVTVYSGASASEGARVIMNSAGIAGYNSSGSPTFSVSASDGSAIFKGDITGASGTFSGNLQVSAGTKTTTISSSTGLLTMSDSSTDWGSSAAISISSFLSGGIGVSTTLGGNSLSFQRGSFTAAHAIADELSGVTTGSYLIQSGSGAAIVLKPNGGSASATFPVQIEGLLRNPIGSISSGTYDAQADTQVAGSMMTATGALIARRDDQIPIFAHRYLGIGAISGNAEQIRFIMDGNDRGGIFSSSTASPSFRSPSDYRLKENIRDYSDSIEVIKSKRIRVFNLKNDPNKTEVVGFIAHEFGTPGDEFVVGEKDAVDADGNPEYQSIATTNLIPYLTGALKEVILRLESLEKRLDVLEG